jgi:hypothetical protein
MPLFKLKPQQQVGQSLATGALPTINKIAAKFARPYTLPFTFIPEIAMGKGPTKAEQIIGRQVARPFAALQSLIGAEAEGVTYPEIAWKSFAKGFLKPEEAPMPSESVMKAYPGLDWKAAAAVGTLADIGIVIGVNALARTAIRGVKALAPEQQKMALINQLRARPEFQQYIQKVSERVSKATGQPIQVVAPEFEKYMAGRMWQMRGKMPYMQVLKWRSKLASRGFVRIGKEKWYNVEYSKAGKRVLEMVSETGLAALKGVPDVKGLNITGEVAEAKIPKKKKVTQVQMAGIEDREFERLKIKGIDVGEARVKLKEIYEGEPKEFERLPKLIRKQLTKRFQEILRMPIEERAKAMVDFGKRYEAQLAKFTEGPFPKAFSFGRELQYANTAEKVQALKAKVNQMLETNDITRSEQRQYLKRLNAKSRKLGGQKLFKLEAPKVEVPVTIEQHMPSNEELGLPSETEMEGALKATIKPEYITPEGRRTLEFKPGYKLVEELRDLNLLGFLAAPGQGTPLDSFATEFSAGMGLGEMSGDELRYWITDQFKDKLVKRADVAVRAFDKKIAAKKAKALQTALKKSGMSKAEVKTVQKKLRVQVRKAAVEVRAPTERPFKARVRIAPETRVHDEYMVAAEETGLAELRKNEHFLEMWPKIVDRYAKGQGISTVQAEKKLIQAMEKDPSIAQGLKELVKAESELKQNLPPELAVGNAGAVEGTAKRAIGDPPKVPGEPKATISPEDKWDDILKNELDLGDRLMNTYHASLSIEQKTGIPLFTQVFGPALRMNHLNNTLNQKYQTMVKDAMGKFRNPEDWGDKFINNAYIYLTNESTNPPVAQEAWKQLTDTQREVVTNIRKLFDQGFEKAKTLGIELGYRKDYLSKVLNRFVTGEALPGPMDVPFKYERLLERLEGEGLPEKHPLVLLRRYWYILSSYESGKLAWYNKARGFSMPTTSLQNWYDRRIADVMSMPIPGSIVWEKRFRAYWPMLKSAFTKLSERMPGNLKTKLHRQILVWDKMYQKGQLVDRFSQDFANLVSKIFLSWNPVTAMINETQKVHIIEQHGLHYFNKGMNYVRTPEFQDLWNKVMPILKSQAAYFIPPGEESFGQKGMKWFRDADTRSRQWSLAASWRRFQDVWAKFEKGEISKKRLLYSKKAEGVGIDVDSLGLEYFHETVQKALIDKIDKGLIWQVPANEAEMIQGIKELVEAGTSDKFGAAFEYGWHSQGIQQFFYEPGSIMDVFSGPGGRMVGSLSTWPFHRLGSLFNLAKMSPKRFWWMMLLPAAMTWAIYGMTGIDVRGKYGLGPLMRVPIGPAPSTAMDLMELSREVYSGSAFGRRRQLFKLRRLPPPVPGGYAGKRLLRARKTGPLGLLPYRPRREKKGKVLFQLKAPSLKVRF